MAAKLVTWICPQQRYKTYYIPLVCFA